MIMTSNRISASLSQADREEVMVAIATIKEKLPFLIDLTAEERKALPKMGDRFARKSRKAKPQKAQV